MSPQRRNSSVCSEIAKLENNSATLSVESSGKSRVRSCPHTMITGGLPVVSRSSSALSLTARSSKSVRQYIPAITVMLKESDLRRHLLAAVDLNQFPRDLPA